MNPFLNRSILWSNRRGAYLRIAALLALCGSALPACAAGADDFSLRALDGASTIRLSNYAGQPVLINFWGSRCKPCVRELPLLDAQARAAPRVQFLGIAIDERNAALAFVRPLRLSYPQALAGAQANTLLRRYGNTLGALPYTVVLDARHEQCASRLGEIDAEWLKTALAGCSAKTQ